MATTEQNLSFIIVFVGSRMIRMIHFTLVPYQDWTAGFSVCYCKALGKIFGHLGGFSKLKGAPWGALGLSFASFGFFLSPMMVLRGSWRSLGLVFRALGSLLEAILTLFRTILSSKTDLPSFDNPFLSSSSSSSASYSSSSSSSSSIPSSLVFVLSRFIIP